MKGFDLVNWQVSRHLLAENKHDRVEEQIHCFAVLLEVSLPQLVVHQVLDKKTAELDVVVIGHAMKLINSGAGRCDLHFGKRVG